MLIKRILKVSLTTKLLRSLSMDSTVKKVAVCQMTSTADKAANMEVVSKLVKRAAQDNVHMVFFPEACDYLCDNKKDSVNYAESLTDGDTIACYRKLAAENKVWISLGGLHEKVPDCPKVYNTHVILNSNGDIVQTYRKIHLFDVELPEKRVRLMESDTAMAGNDIVTPVKTVLGNIGLAICYDLRFPELGVLLASMGCDILTYPSAFTAATGQAHWEVLLRARAIETQCYVIAAAQTGAHNAKRSSHGHALVVDPWGAVLADCGAGGPGYAVAEVDPARVARLRREMPVFEHRRNDVYSLCPLSLRSRPLHRPSRAASPAPSTTPPGHAPAGPALTFGQVSVPLSCVFLRTELCYAFVNLRCVVPGHVLVAPLRLVKRNEDLTAEEAADFFNTILRVQKLMERVHEANSSTINIQDGPDAGQTIWHLHCHVMPRKPKDFKDSDLIYLELAKHDRLTSCSPLKPPRSIEEMEKEAAHLREQLEIMKQPL